VLHNAPHWGILQYFFAEHIVSFWCKRRTVQAETPIINIDRNMEIEFLAGQLDLPKTRRVVSVLERALEQMDRNVNPRLLAEILLLDWPKAGS
jgi:hypothetical protein